MGMDQEAAGMLRQGTQLADNVYDLLAGTTRGQNPSVAEETARMQEFEAGKQAADLLANADDTADTLRAEREAARATKNAAWGASGLEMSGSKELLRETARISDDLDEEDIRAKGERTAQDALDQGRATGNMTRINGSATPIGSTLSLGSKIYKYGR
ncbi:MAG: hypothetical protein KUA35_09665 [Pseudodesulfovibrio sp.]|uniref:Uncharacterized protein n=1 Tax=Pseudodesulfovibrio aespoeensis (strain ATCC 700646 / DSM 10631 / Aspo-2) TaxID=643562 RepID=E6VWF9_PSEA9|nr:MULTISPECIES: hypothetical protein [Pseudodesulfovibrio]MBU4193067.1 hypothetical protein [Pseudomonadota bacterium]ADU61365.1 hypothetical protein Daes_0340 [Pseudodesulfovibrio aespoeensis Aspo-2]MBU4243834.1 hypothetical protein [Pseudomonadota bacterium]MBU4378532.1 hypothetical protein [Pseudomonadota bacterium]MBU4474758.1 hypothetical protein [Pseudomonadota bacterium]